MTVSLPMYDWPEMREATDGWWAGIARHLGVSHTLRRGPDHAAAWRDPGLLFSQTCGYPMTHEYKGKLHLVATPHYAVDGCEGPRYSSFVLARENRPLEGFRGARAAVNNADSMSGMLALKLVFAPVARQRRFFGEVTQSGRHVKSLIAVRDGEADVCAVDAVCVGLARRYRPEYLEGLVEVARSPLVPGLPYVTIAGDPARLRSALDAAFADDALRHVRERLFLSGCTALRPQAYDRIIDLEQEMERAGGLALL